MAVNTLIGTETVLMERFHLVQKLYSSLDIPGRSPFYLYINSAISALKSERGAKSHRAGVTGHD